MKTLKSCLPCFACCKGILLKGKCLQCTLLFLLNFPERTKETCDFLQIYLRPDVLHIFHRKIVFREGDVLNSRTQAKNAELQRILIRIKSTHSSTTLPLLTSFKKFQVSFETIRLFFEKQFISFEKSYHFSRILQQICFNLVMKIFRISFRKICPSTRTTGK